MATVPGALIWEIVKKNNSLLVKEFGNGSQMVQFNKESNNLYNLNSFKYSGLANKKTVTVQPSGKDLSVVLATTKSKKQNKPGKSLHKSVMNKEFPHLAKTVANQDKNHWIHRKDLKDIIQRMRSSKASNYGQILANHVLKEQYQSEEQQKKISLEQVLQDDLEENPLGVILQVVIMRSTAYRNYKLR